MPKRFTDTELWDEDWFMEMPTEFQMLWFYVKDDCNHAGIWKPKKKKFELITGFHIELDKFLEYANYGKERIKVLPNGRWFLPGFFVFQYGTTFNEKNNVHRSIEECLKSNNLMLGSIRGLVEVKKGTP